jgi:hypothetical protein
MGTLDHGMIHIRRNKFRRNNMKIRSGFVSNSSSSSFCILGISLSYDEVTKLCKKTGGIDDTIHSPLGWISDTYDYGDDIIIGMHPWNQMQDDETPPMFRKRITAEIKKQLPKLDLTEKKIDLYEGEYSC